MGCAPIAHVLYSKIMRYNPQNPKWVSRDRFVLSNGHACALLYSMLHLTGYDLSLDELKRFRKLGAITAGHPENVLHPAIEVSTGPLGQGISNAVGLALAETHLAAEFNAPGLPPLVDSFTYVLCGDGCLQEGVSSEASSLAGHLGLGKLIVLYDDNKITIDGETSLSFTEDVLARYTAYGWHVQHVANGDSDIDAIDAAIRAAQAVSDKPSIIKVSTTIGFGSTKAGSEKAHGEPLGTASLKAVKTAFGFDPEASFVVPDDVKAFYSAAAARSAGAEASWKDVLAKYTSAHPERAAEFLRRFSGTLPDGWFAKLPRYTPADKADATRNLSGAVLNVLAATLPEVIGGSADLTPSNKTQFKGAVDYQHATPGGRYIRFGVREHAMAAICNGIAAYGGLLPYCGTFLNFIGYAAGATRLSALSNFRVIYVGTHDSIGLGEDGPTHQPVEMIEMLRATPNMFVWRPADGNEVSAAYAAAVANTTGPAVIALSRQNVPQLAGSSIEAALRGGYTLSTVGDASAPLAMIFAATGTEVSIAVEAAAKFVAATPGVSAQVASLPCLEVFDRQPHDYRATVLPPGIPVVSIEAACIKGWEKYAHAWVGLTTFGISAPAPDVYKKLGITADAAVTKAVAVREYFSGKPVPAVPALSPFFVAPSASTHH